MSEQKIFVSSIKSTSQVFAPTLSLRTFLSVHHVWAAAHLAKLSANIEQTYDGNFNRELFLQHRSYVIGSILSSVAFLEATINELIEDIIENHGDRTKYLSPEIRNRIDKAWNRKFATFPKKPQGLPEILHKFQFLMDSKPIEAVKSPFQEVVILIYLRNALIHYRPETLPAIPKPIPDKHYQHENLAEQLQPYLDDRLNPLFKSSGNPLFPDHCLGYGCAKWGIGISVSFVDAFFSRIGLSSTIHETYRPHLELPDIWKDS